MVSITVKIHHGFKQFLPRWSIGKPFDISLEDGTMVGELLKDRIKFPAGIPKLILVNGLHTEESKHLQDGDRVSLFVPMAGG